MALSEQAMKEIASLAVNAGGSGISLSKQMTTPGVGHLIVSLGGSGADMIREAKGLINQNCSADHDKHLPPERVAYVAFDTDSHEKEKVSSEKTGQVSLDDDELTLMSDGLLGLLLDKSTMRYNKDTYPWIYRWLDTGIPPLSGGNGAGGIRQAGRAMLFLEIEKVVDKLKTALTRLITGTNVERLNVYLLSGISGGTGSGTFLDMAYIVRQVANEVIGSGTFRPDNIRVYGYLIMPDVNLLNADAKTKPSILRNAGAALQELDHAMKLKEIGDYYKCQYSKTMTVNTTEQPFNYVHLVCAKAKGASMPDKPYQHCLDTVAGSILCFVSSMKKSGGDKVVDGQKASTQFPVDSYYSNIKNMQVSARAKSTYKERSNCYIALGYDCWEIPADRLVKYIFTLMFSKVNDLFENEPSQEDANKLMGILGFYCDQKTMDLLGAMTAPLNPTQYQPRQLFGPEAMDLEKQLPYRNCQTEINNGFVNYYNGIRDNLRTVLQQDFLDAERGPVWTNHVLVSGTSARINALDRLVNEQKHLAIQRRTEAQAAQASYTQRINDMRAAYYNKRKVPAKACQEYVGLWNGYFQANMYVYCYDLLIGNEEALGLLDGRYKRGFYDEVLNESAVLNNKWLEVTRQVLEELKRIVQQNTDEFRKATVTDTGHGFTWSSGDIPNLDKAIGGIIATKGIDHDTMMQNFLKRLLSKADEWAQSVEVRKFIEEFLEEEAQGVLNVSLEGLLSSCFDDTKPLSKSIEEDLMPYMVETNAKPLFDGDQDLTYAGNITIPQGCNEIEKGVENYIGGRSNYTLQTSYLRNRISVICTAVGLSLHDYTLYEKCEQQISLDPNVKGLFLNQGVENFVGRVNHMEMPLPFVIPSRKRAVMSPAPERFARIEKGLIEEFRQMRKDRYPFLSFKKTTDQQDYNLSIILSVGLNQSDFHEMTQEEKYKNYNGAVDTDKLRDLIVKLETIRYDTGLPQKTDLPNELKVCENLLNSATQEMKDRYDGLLPAEEKKVKEEVAWEVAEWYYVSAYSFYMKAKEEKAKYDEIGKKIDELKGILDQEEEKPRRSVTMAKMLAVDIIKYDPKYFRYVYELNGDDMELLPVEPAFRKIREMKLFEELERLRSGNYVEKQLYEELNGRRMDYFDDEIRKAYDKAYEEKNENGKYPKDAKYIKIFIDLYKKLDGIRAGADRIRADIESFLARRNATPTRTENAQTKEFYTVYAKAIEDELKAGDIGGYADTEGLNILDRRGNLRSSEEIFEDDDVPVLGWVCPKCHRKNDDSAAVCPSCGHRRDDEPPVAGWDCPKCGKKGNDENFGFCPVCGTPKPPKGWDCPKCGKKGNDESFGFCPVCGTPKPQEGWSCPKCGRQNDDSTGFCPGCGTPKPVKMQAPSGDWICTSCGRKNSDSINFCPGCGSKRP